MLNYMFVRKRINVQSLLPWLNTDHYYREQYIELPHKFSVFKQLNNVGSCYIQRESCEKPRQFIPEKDVSTSSNLKLIKERKKGNGPENKCDAATSYTSVIIWLNLVVSIVAPQRGSILCPNLLLYNSNSFSAGVTPAINLKFTIKSKIQYIHE